MDKEEENKHTEKPHVNQETLDAIEEGHRIANDPNVACFPRHKKPVRIIGIVKSKVGLAA